MDDDRRAVAAMAPFYDLDHDEIVEDVDFYGNLARHTALPGQDHATILELGAGTGRVALPLARHGHQVTAVDYSAAMLALARAKLDAETAPNLQLIEADMRDFSLPQRFDLAIVALNTFMHLVEPEDQLQALSCIHQHLRPGGLLCIDLFNPDPARLTGQDQELLLAWVKPHPATGGWLSKLVGSSLDQARQLQQVTIFYDEVGAEGQLRRTTAVFTLHYFFRYEMEHLLYRQGFAVEGVFGSYELEPYASISPRMIFLARRP